MSDKQIMLIEDNPDDRDLTIRALRKQRPQPRHRRQQGTEALTMLLGNWLVALACSRIAVR